MNLENSILPFLGRTVKFLDMYIEEEFARNGINLSKMQFVFLTIISRNNCQPQNNLAFLTGRDKTTFTRNINTLEKKGWVERELSDKDKRIKLVCITELGKSILQDAAPIIETIIDEVEEGITEKERDSFLHTLATIRTKLTSLREDKSK